MSSASSSTRPVTDPGHGSDATPVRAHRGAGRLTLVLTPVLTVLAAMVPVLFNRDFYFYADTPEGAYGQWYELGDQLLSGNWPLMNPAAWMAGNYVAEGQWGLWNPLVLLMALFVHVVPNAVVASTIIKLVFLALAALGIRLLVRDLGASPFWALVAAVAAPLAGFTLYMDATSWVTNLFVWVFFPWTLWGIRRFAEGRGSILWPAISGYVLVSFGYVQGTVMLILLYVSLLIVAVVRRHWGEVWRTLVVGVIHGLVALAVYLPGVLTSSVTSRADKVDNDGFMVLTLSGLATGLSGFSTGDLSGWWGRFTDLPLLYVAWFIPLLLLVSGRRVRALAPRMAALWVFGVLALVLAIGPSEMGPLRFPTRTLPWIALVAIISTAVLLDRGLRRRPGRWSLILMLTSLGLSAWLVYAADPMAWHWPRNGAHLLLAGFGVLVVWVLARRAFRRTSAGAGQVARRRAGRNLALLIPVCVLLVSLAVSGLQAKTFAPLVTSRSDYPAEVTDYQDAVPDARGDGIVVGDALALPHDFWDETVFGNSWYLNSDAKFQNLYTPVGYEAYATEYCMLFDGRTCAGLAQKLFEVDPTTGLPLADLLSLDTVQILTDQDHSISDLEAMPVPEGWSVADTTEQSVTWTRDEQTGPAGTATWASDGVSFSQGDESNLSSTVHIDEVGPEGGTIVFSRLAWPGYTVDGGSQGPALRGYLLTVDVPADAAGKDITVTFRPPAWKAAVGAMGAAAAITVLGTALQIARSRRSRASHVQAARSTTSAGEPPR